jgi:predicted metal-dependent hydrolase
MFNFVFKRRRRRIVKRKPASKASKAEYEKYKEVTRVLVHARLGYFNQFYNFAYNRVAIRNTKTRWGSCSNKRNLNFSYKLALIDPELADYVVLHELCHLGEMNHGANFWKLMEGVMPDYNERRKSLQKIAL